SVAPCNTKAVRNWQLPALSTAITSRRRRARSRCEGFPSWRPLSPQPHDPLEAPAYCAGPHASGNAERGLHAIPCMVIEGISDSQREDGTRWLAFVEAIAEGRAQVIIHGTVGAQVICLRSQKYPGFADDVG